MKTINQTNWGVLFSLNRKHIVFNVGASFRTYFYTKNAIEEYNIVDDTKLNENWNLVYVFGYSIKPIENEWNITLNLKNFDNF